MSIVRETPPTTKKGGQLGRVTLVKQTLKITI